MEFTFIVKIIIRMRIWGPTQILSDVFEAWVTPIRVTIK